jgi:putative polymerase
MAGPAALNIDHVLPSGARAGAIDRYSAEAVPRAHPAAAYGVVAAAMVFNPLLCAAATRGVHVSLALVAATEVCIIAAACMLAWRRVLGHLLVPGLLVVFCVAGLWLIDPSNDPKIAVEMAMIGGFTCLGMSAPDQRNANRLVWGITLLVLVVGLWELLALPSFEHYFDIISYYIDKGTLSADHLNDTGTRLSENGVRPEGYGRQLLPGLLGPHRVGSIFLEPVSAGNFTVICISWVLARQRMRQDGWILILLALTIGILADARFSVVSSAAVAAMLLTGAWRWRSVVAALPFVMIGLLMVIGMTVRMEVDNSVAGRLVGSGQLLAGWSPFEWLGFTVPGGVSMDTGYSYVMGNLGVIAAAGIWLVVALRPKPPVAARFFAAISVYLTLGLSTGYSSFSIKTAALLWFLYGTLLVVERGAAAAKAPLAGVPGAFRNYARTR